MPFSITCIGCRAIGSSLFIPKDNAERLTLSSVVADGIGFIGLMVSWLVVDISFAFLSGVTFLRGGNRGGGGGLALCDCASSFAAITEGITFSTV